HTHDSRTTSLCRASLHHPPRSPPFPYTTLFRSRLPVLGAAAARPRRRHHPDLRRVHRRLHGRRGGGGLSGPAVRRGVDRAGRRPDRKSTRLNSSHVKISYAVFCLKKKKAY